MMSTLENKIESALGPCNKPPAGWSCSRGAGHEGPCAARMIVQEVGWLLDDGLLCIGVESSGNFGLVTYTDERAIRFARRQDAENALVALTPRGLGFLRAFDRLHPVEHGWG